MNENLNLYEILKDCPRATRLYSPLYGEVILDSVSSDKCNYPIVVITKNGYESSFDKYGIYQDGYAEAECLLFPSKDQRDWSKFTAPWYKNEKKEKFDLSTLKPFSHVLVRDDYLQDWEGEIFTRYDEGSSFSCIGLCSSFAQCIPYNDETKHLLGTDNEAPEYYRYWEN